MRIVIVATGTWGDVRPNVVLGRALQNAGYEVVVVAAEEFRQWVEARGVGFAGLSINIQAVLDMLVASDPGLISTFKTMKTMNRIFKPSTLQAGKEVAAVVREGDALLVIESGSYLTNGIVEKYGLRPIHINMQPFLPTREFPAMGIPAMPAWMPMRGAFNRLTYGLLRQGSWSMMGQRGNDLRTEFLGLPRQTRAKQEALVDVTPSLLLVSRHVIPPPADWQPHQRVTGYLFDEDRNWEAPQDLLDFLAGGEKPVYLGFGSMRVKQPEETTRLVLDAVKRSGKRAILLSGWAGIGAADMPKNVFLLNYAPHTWLFPRTAAVVHHGGAGTTAVGMRAGVPSIIVPILADQPFWGQRVYDLGVGTQPISRGKLTAEKLASAIIEATSSRDMQENAKILGEKISVEDGVGEAVKAIKEFLA